MEQLCLDMASPKTSEIANKYYREITDLLEKQQMGYDLSQIRMEHREPESSDAYDTILMFKQPFFHIKGKKTVYLYFSNSFAKKLAKFGYELDDSNKSGWPRIAVDNFLGFERLIVLVEQFYEECLRNSDTFGCCGSYLECSDAGHCIKTDIMFAGKCAYRQNLISGRIFYGKNKNI